MSEREEVCGLLYGCPHDKRVEDCPFSQWSMANLAEGVKWIKALSCAEFEEIMEHHTQCSKSRGE